MWNEDKTLANIMKLFFDMTIGENSYTLEDDDLIYYWNNPKSALNCWVRLDRNTNKSLNLNWGNLFKQFTLDENGNIINNPNYVENPKKSVLSLLSFSRIFISKNERKSLDKMEQVSYSRFKMGLYEETIIEYNNEKYYIVWD